MMKTKRQFAPMRVGELSRATGVSIRTLHYYDEIGLLSPSVRTDGGHRLYAEAEIGRLQRILSLRSLGFSLEEVASCLESPAEFSPRAVIGLHIERLTEGIESQRRLRARLEEVAARLDREEVVSPEEFITLIEAIQMHEKYLTKEQLADMEARAKELGPDGLKRAEEQWRVLMDNVRTEMAAGTDPSEPRVRALATEWMELVRAATGGDAGTTKGIRRMYEEETNINGIDTSEIRAMNEYIAKALA